MDDAAPVHVAAQEREDVAALKLAHDLHRDLVGFGRADDGREAGHTPVHQLDAPRPELDIIDRAVQVAVQSVVRPAVIRAGEGRAARQLETGQRLWLEAVHITDRFDRLGSQQGRHAAVQRFAQVGGPVAGRGDRVQQAACVFQHRPELAQRLHFPAGHAQDQRQIVGGVGEGDRGIRTFIRQGLPQHGLRFRYEQVCAAQGARCDIA